MGEGIPISRANSMEGAPLPARASQGEGAGGFHDGVQMGPFCDVCRRNPLESKMLMHLRFVRNAKCSGSGLRFRGVIRSRFDWMNTSWTRCLRFVRQSVLALDRCFGDGKDEADEKAALRQLERVRYAAGVAAVGSGS